MAAARRIRRRPGPSSWTSADATDDDTDDDADDDTDDDTDDVIAARARAREATLDVPPGC